MSATIDKASSTSSITSQELSTSRSEERAPRFTSAALAGGRVHSAKHHSFSMPAGTFMRMNSEDPSQSVPGAYVEGHQVKSDTVSDEHLSHAGHDHRPRLKVDLPTHEEPSGSRQGVGSLPGPMNAEYVAMLPDERMHMHDVEIHEAELHRKAHHTKGSKREPKHMNIATQPSSQLPTTERPSGSNVGIGSMPGKNRESGVATLPEERIEGRPYGQGHTGFESSLDTGWKAQHHHHINRCPVSYALLGISSDEETTSKDMTAQGQPAFEWSHYLEPKAQPPPAVNRCPVDAALLGFDTDDVKSKDKDRMDVDKKPVPAPHQFQSEPSLAQKRKISDTTEPNLASQVERAAEGVMGAVEEVASEMYHGAENLIHNVEAYMSSSYEGARPHSERAVVGGIVNEPQSAPALPAKPADKDIAGAMSHPQAFVTTSKDLPKDVGDEYARKREYDLFGEPIDTDQFVFDDDLSYEGDRGAAGGVTAGPAKVYNIVGKTEVRIPAGEKHAMPKIPGEGTAVGYGGVEYNLEGKEELLPGYPTPEGMATLIGDRMKDDRARALEAQAAATAGVLSTSGSSQSETRRNRAQLLRPEASRHHAVIETPSNISSVDELPHDSLSNHQIIEELREVPIFQGGGATATGKYEAVFEPFKERSDAQTEYEVKKEKDRRANEHQQAHPSLEPYTKMHEYIGAPTKEQSYLGKPVSKAEEVAQVEEARNLASKKAGIN